MSLYAVIMAGGIGSRFWPFSRKENPKQFLSVLEDASLIQATLGRLQGFVAPENTLVVTHERYVERTREQLPALPGENILAEPISRNTAPCIAYAALELLKRDADATMIVLPADHRIQNVKKFLHVLSVAVEKAQDPGSIVTIGIQPTHPATGYGYIQCRDLDPKTSEVKPSPVKTFAEKPDANTAGRFLDSGDFLWNSGMFVWRAETILSEMEKHLPEVVEAFKPVAEIDQPEHQLVHDAFSNAPRISIDYGVMERAEKVFVVPGKFGWSDVGDWNAVFNLSEKDDAENVTRGHVLAEESHGNLVFAGDRLVVLVGIRDTIVVNTDDAILVCDQNASQKVKNVVDFLHLHAMDRYV